MAILMSSAVRSPRRRLYSRRAKLTMSWSISSPPIRMDRLTTMPPRLITAPSVVPPPISTIRLPDGSLTGSPAPISAAMGSSMSRAQRAPAFSAASFTARFSTSVTPKSLMTPSRSGRTAMMLAGVRPTIRLASAPMARTFLVRASMATTDGSLITIPRSRTWTSVFAVPRSMPMSREKMPRMRSSMREGDPVRVGGSGRGARPSSIPGTSAVPARVRGRAETASSGGAVRRHPGPIERDPAIPHRDPCIVADHEVVQDADVEEPARGQGLGRQMEVIRRGRGVTAWVVVDEDDARGREPDGVPKQLPDPDNRRAEVALIGRNDALDDVLRVEDDDAQLLALEAPHLENEPVGDIPGRSNGPAGRRPIGKQPSPELERSLQLSGLDGPDTRDLDEFETGRPGEAGQAIEPRDRVLGKIHSGAAACARAPQEGDQLRGREPGGAPEFQALTRPLGGRQLAERPALREREERARILAAAGRPIWHRSAPRSKCLPRR